MKRRVFSAELADPFDQVGDALPQQQQVGPITFGVLGRHDHAYLVPATDADARVIELEGDHASHIQSIDAFLDALESHLARAG